MRRIAIALQSNPYGMQILRGIAQVIAENPDWQVARSKSALPLLDWKDIPAWTGDGMIIVAGDPMLLPLLRSAPFPVVNVSHRHAETGLHTVGPDDTEIGRLGAEHLLSRGLRRTVFILRDGESHAEQRAAAFEKTVRAAGGSCRRIILRPRGQGWDELLVDLTPPTAIMAANDDLARSVIEHATAAGLRVPQDLAVLGVDNDDLQATLSVVPHSSIDPDAREIGLRAALLLGQLMARRHTGRLADIRVPPKGIVVRRSTDIFAAQDPLTERAVAMVSRDCEKGLTAGELADALGISRRLLEKRLQTHLGVTPLTLITRVRLEKAQGLLRSTDFTVKEIARRCGYPSLERMCTVFARELRATPGQYRRRFRAAP